MESEAYFFDFDGVIVDSVQIKAKAFALLFESHGSQIQEKIVSHHLNNGGMTRSEKIKYYFSVEDWMIPLILKHGVTDWIMTTNRYILSESIFLLPPKNEIVKLDHSKASYIFENSDYKDYISIEYTAERLSNDISAGILINNKLVAWGFTHDDGALGFLHVLEEYRGNGYGSDILSGLIQMRREVKKPVFGNVVPGNIASVKLLTKLGFEFDRSVSWIKLL